MEGFKPRQEQEPSKKRGSGLGYAAALAGAALSGPSAHEALSRDVVSGASLEAWQDAYSVIASESGFAEEISAAIREFKANPEGGLKITIPRNIASDSEKLRMIIGEIDSGIHVSTGRNIEEPVGTSDDIDTQKETKFTLRELREMEDMAIRLGLDGDSRAKIAAAEAVAALEGVDFREAIRVDEMYARHMKRDPVSDAYHHERRIEEYEAEQAETSGENEAEPNRISAALKAAKS